MQERGLQMKMLAMITSNLVGVIPMTAPMRTRKLGWVNEAWSRELLWTMDDIYNMHLLDLLDPSSAYEVLAWWSSNKKETINARIRRKTQKGRPYEYNSYEWACQVIGGKIYIIGKDIGAAQQHQDAMAKALQALQSRNDDLERFASVAAHQLRSPPRTIAGIADALSEDYGHLLDEEGKLFVQDIRNDAAQMAEIVDGLYRFSKVRTAKDMSRLPVDLNEVLQEISDTYAKEADHTKQLQWRDLPVVLGDRVLLKEVFVNLIGNAFKFNESDVPTVKISASKRDDGRWTLVVADNGIGIDPVYQPKLFTMFQRVHTNYAGTGVGLALVAAIIHKLGGTISVDSKPQEGATFKFDLPGSP